MSARGRCAFDGRGESSVRDVRWYPIEQGDGCLRRALAVEQRDRPSPAAPDLGGDECRCLRHEERRAQLHDFDVAPTEDVVDSGFADGEYVALDHVAKSARRTCAGG